jgi:hypothetical protein
MKAIFLILVAASASAACLAVTGDRVLASDLARADVRFAALPGALPLAFTPHVFHADELRRIARANGITLDSASDVCFEIALHPPAESQFLDAMRRSLPAAVITMLEMFPSPIPSGEIMFPASTREPQLWRGYVQYTPTRRFPVWARVSVSLPAPAVRRGDTVPVEVHSGRAVIRFDAIAQKDVAPGAIADLRNPATGRTFHARIDGSKAILVVGKGPA